MERLHGAGDATGWSRWRGVFISINAKKPIAIHNLADALAFQGKISLSGKDAVKVNVKLTPEMAAFLRSQSFDEYTADGWKVNITGTCR